MLRLLLTVVTVGIITITSEARPGKLPWSVDPHYRQNNKHNTPEFHGDNGAFYYPDQEFFDNDDPSSQGSRSDSDDFSGWYEELGDDEDSKMQNTINTMPRDLAYNQYNYHNRPIKDFRPDDIIHDIFPHVDSTRSHNPEILEEEHFGNEINDIDKIEELSRRMAEMQREMREMQSMLADRNFLYQGRRK